MKFRQHRGSLSDSMNTMVEIEPTYADIWQQVLLIFPKVAGRLFNEDDLRVESYCYDERIGWDTHIVEIKNFGVIGFCDQMPQK